MGRMPGFDYKRPFFYMVTLKRAAGFPPFSHVVDDAACHYLEPNELTRLFTDIIKTFHNTWFCIEPITCFAIMPDHLHLLIKLRDTEPRVSLPVLVRMLVRTLEEAFFAWRSGGADRCKTLTESCEGKRFAVARSAGQHLFAFEWHDWIVKQEGQLAAFTRYIRENPARAWTRHINRPFFTTVRQVVFAGRTWQAYGNLELLKLPVLEPFRCSRRWAEGRKEWREALTLAERIGPGGAGVGTFMSPCEKACGNAISKAGGSLIVLYPEGFGERWHPTRNKEALCAKGRMLCLSLWEASPAKLDNATLYTRCHEMGDAVVAALGTRVPPAEQGAAKP